MEMLMGYLFELPHRIYDKHTPEKMKKGSMVILVIIHVGQAGRGSVPSDKILNL